MNAQKYERRLKMNRRSAAASRVRRDAYIKSLEKHLDALDEKNRNMELGLVAAREETAQLRRMVPRQVRNVPEVPIPFPDIDAFLNDGNG